MSINMDFELGWKPHFAETADGLSLHSRIYGVQSDNLPIVCLAGLTRNSIDFHPLAMHLASIGHYVVAIDTRGRGKSDYDPDWSHYSVPVELSDCITVLNDLNIQKAIFISTSRGGMLTMLMATCMPDRIAGVVLNDIGPVIEINGLKRIKSYVGKMVVPPSYDDAIKILKFISNGQFSGISEEEWQYFVRTTWATTPDGLAVRYDLNIAKPMETVNLDEPIPDMWAAFEALQSIPVLTIRGENSDLFSAETQSEMVKRHPNCYSFTVKGQAHAPILADMPSITRIEKFITSIDT